MGAAATSAIFRVPNSSTEFTRRTVTISAQGHLAGRSERFPGAR